MKFSTLSAKSHAEPRAAPRDTPRRTCRALGTSPRLLLLGNHRGFSHKLPPTCHGPDPSAELCPFNGIQLHVKANLLVRPGRGRPVAGPEDTLLPGVHRLPVHNASPGLRRHGLQRDTLPLRCARSPGAP